MDNIPCIRYIDRRTLISSRHLLRIIAIIIDVDSNERDEFQ